MRFLTEDGLCRGFYYTGILRLVFSQYWYWLPILCSSSWGQLPDLFNVTGSDHVVELMHLGVVLRPVTVTCSAVLLS